MKSITHPPKLLPRLANTAGISLRRAEILWDAALRHAARTTGENETPAYWAAAMDRLMELVAAESLREDAASFGWRPWVRMNERFWQAPLAMLEAFTVNSVRNWRSFKPLQFG